MKDSTRQQLHRFQLAEHEAEDTPRADTHVAATLLPAAAPPQAHAHPSVGALGYVTSGASHALRPPATPAATPAGQSANLACRANSGTRPCPTTDWDGGAAVVEGRRSRWTQGERARRPMETSSERTGSGPRMKSKRG